MIQARPRTGTKRLKQRGCLGFDQAEERFAGMSEEVDEQQLSDRMLHAGVVVEQPDQPRDTATRLERRTDPLKDLFGIHGRKRP